MIGQKGQREWIECAVMKLDHIFIFLVYFFQPLLGVSLLTGSGVSHSFSRLHIHTVWSELSSPHQKSFSWSLLLVRNKGTTTKPVRCKSVQSYGFCLQAIEERSEEPGKAWWDRSADGSRLKPWKGGSTVLSEHAYTPARPYREGAG